MIEITDLHKKFGKLKVLDGVDLKIDRGGVYMILGPNGSGKTTLIKILLGMVLSDSGGIKLFDKDVKGQWRYRNGISYLSQIANFPPNLKVRELFALMKDVRPSNSAESELIEAFLLEPYLNSKLGSLSGGTRQKVNIVATLMYDCPLIILDEPTVGLDPISLVSLKRLIRRKREEGKTILITTHIMSFVEEMADEIVFLLEGKVYFRGNVGALKLRGGSENLEVAMAGILTQQHV